MRTVRGTSTRSGGRAERRVPAPWTIGLCAGLAIGLPPRIGRGQVDTLAVVLDARPMIGTKFLGSFGYDPTRDAIFLIAYGGDPTAPGNPGVVRVSDVGSAPTAEVMVSQTQLQLYYTDGNPNLASPPVPGGLLLNPRPIGATPAFGMAVVADGELTRPSGGSVVADMSRRVYSYDLQSPPPGMDGRAVFTTRATLADMQAAAGATTTTSFVQRQFAWSGDGQSVYVADSSPGFGGLWKVGIASGGVARIMAGGDVSAEPGVRTAGGIDTIFLSGGGSTGNAGGIDFVTHDGTTTSPRQVAVPAARLLDFFEASTAMPSQRVQSLAAVGDDLYFVFFTNASVDKPESRHPGIYRVDAQGRISKVVNRTQRAAAFGAVNTVFDRLQPRTVAVSGASGTFAATQLLYRENGVSTVAGATAFAPVDFNRDSRVTSADLALLVPQVTVRGDVKGAVADLAFDMNGNDTVDWKDVQIVQGFLDYAADPALAGRLVPTLPIRADADLNGVVDFADFEVLRQTFGTASQPFTRGDYDGDGQVSFADVQSWINSYGFRSAVVGGGVPMAAFDQAAWGGFLAGLDPPAVTIDVASGSRTQYQAGYRTIVIASTLGKTGAGTLVLDAANTFSGTTAVNAGTLELADPAAASSSRLRVSAGATARVAAGVATTVAGLDLAGGGLVDLTTGGMTVTSGMTPTGVVSAILAGRGAEGDWRGASGITSSAAASAAAAGVPRVVGWLDNGDGSLSFAFSAAGDTNIDGQVDILDAANFLAGGRFDAGGPATWNEGDFNYDAQVDVLDAADFLAAALFDGGPFIPTQATVVRAVPEPSPAALLAPCGWLVWRRLRRRSSPGGRAAAWIAAARSPAAPPDGRGCRPRPWGRRSCRTAVTTSP